jgi:hypothetical protein
LFGTAGLGGVVLGGLTIGGLSAGVAAIGGVSAGVLAMGRDVHGDFVLTGVLTAHRVKDIIAQQYPQLWDPLAWLFSTFVS